MKRSLPPIRKISQALYYLQSKTNNPDRFNKLYLLKMIYFADRYHLRHFECLATDDKYFAMKMGPVASCAYDILKGSSSLKVIAKNAYEVEIPPQDIDELSESFREALDFALKEFGHYNWTDLSNISHCYPEWKKHEIGLSDDELHIPMNILDFFDDPDNDACFFTFGKTCDPFKEDKEFLNLLKEDYVEDLVAI